MDKKSLYLYYYSMIVYLFGSVPFILFAILIKPISALYHENAYQMTSPVLGNFGAYINLLFAITLIFIFVSIILMIMSLYHNNTKKGKISKRTIITPVILYIFTFAAIGVALI